MEMLELAANLFSSVLFVIVMFLFAIVLMVQFISRFGGRKTLGGRIRRHLGVKSALDASVVDRMFPMQVRADVVQAIEQFLAESKVVFFAGVAGESHMESANLSNVLNSRHNYFLPDSKIVSPEYEEVDIGEEKPLRVLKNGVWLAKYQGTNFVLLAVQNTEIVGCGFQRRIRVQLATAASQNSALAETLFSRLEKAVELAKSYRGKVLSLESEENYTGQTQGVKVHSLKKIPREEVILPASTVELLDRNVLKFTQQRAKLRELKMSTKKGLLFYGPPGTGKTHTIRYLAGALENHTTLIITAEQIGMLGEYMTLARLLQPSMVVLEDVDLIARTREQSSSPQAESLLNKLLNEMDGMKESADILFVLTTNRPEMLEAALSSRPGRVDQAIEFPLPAVAERAKLVRLYAGGIPLTDDLVQAVVKRTERVSAAFIKELLRRASLFYLERGGAGPLDLDDIDRAIDEMMFSGGSLNLKLLGAEGRIAEEAF